MEVTLRVPALLKLIFIILPPSTVAILIVKSIGSYVTFDCQRVDSYLTQWRYEQTVLTYNGQILITEASNFKQTNLSVLTNNSLWIEEISVNHEGNYDCSYSDNKSIIINYTLKIKVTPEVYITINGSKYFSNENQNGSRQTNEIFVNAEETFTAYCCAIGARAPIELKWTLNNQTINSSIDSFNSTRGDVNRLVDQTAMLSTILESDQGTITCTSIDRSIVGHTQVVNVIVDYKTNVCPEVTLWINGENMKTLIDVDSKVESFAICNVTKPAINTELYWEVKNEEINISSNDFVNGSGREIQMNFLPRRDSGSIQCIASESQYCSVNQSKTIRVRVLSDVITTTGYEEITEEVKSTPWTLIISILPVIAIVISIPLLLFLRKKYSTPSIVTRTSLSASSVTIPVPSVSREVLPTNTTRTEGIDMVHHPQDRVTIISNEDDALVVRCCDVQLTCQLPGEGTIKYYLATTTTINGNGSKIIAKTVSDDARMKDMLNFRALAKNVMTLRKHENIAEILGVALEDVPHFIYQEHIECGTLKDVLLRNYQHFSDSSKVATAQLAEHEKTLQLTVYAVDVCNGMFFLASQKFLHPGLAARKVLLTSSGKCKLYDFWPVDLAQERVDSILQSKFPPLAWLAPETVFLGHYKEKSDVWNFGVVVWEIYSLGDTPFGGLTCPEIEKKLRAKDNLDQPLACPGGLFDFGLKKVSILTEEI
ncbi:uncharacterized protein [Apostichopus japonicus]|uniref:uncharacterized protein isoform X2 n=1 Tax=Stichopus japonicus TaxID=307972 RepID=UPI003AB2588E